MELPVIGTTVAGLPEVIRPPWGTVVEAGDVDALATAIESWRRLASDVRRDAGSAGRRWLHENHRQELATRHLIELIDRSAART
jgi:glycosyltransferase involved in cell wall biosynthesis